jgi:5-formyltetrahydrofolate cyclo-ligase
MQSKSELRKALRKIRREHVATLDVSTSALLFRMPPAPLLELIPEGARIGIYYSVGDEAPATAYAQYFAERGHEIALPRFQSESDPMHFALWSDPFGKSNLVPGSFGLMEPLKDAQEVVPDVLIIPLLGFTERGERLGQGGGHYDRWLADHPDAIAIGMAWDMQLCEKLPVERHDIALDAIVTPTRFYGPFNAR